MEQKKHDIEIIVIRSYKKLYDYLYFHPRSYLGKSFLTLQLKIITHVEGFGKFSVFFCVLQKKELVRENARFYQLEVQNS